ncbi:uncharacterized protein (DUF2147 family) [Hydrogenophaga palleronii]|uniref:Uncharacterized protein (DUF2147 family) n=1 Tax=Hydrogenophaga palleronii TaxID=65655 RepID=A0ABU1WRC1_9BURK|nr:DUF2147 domain-containing protein [Hydrogenophaga palleronii]MDR7151836.1 uncharacterized protein (DUF2147 family) [Hydrogenophaga palleronii]
MKVHPWMTALAIGSAMVAAQAQDKADDFTGYWMTAQRDGVVQLARCPLYKNAPPTGLCGVIVWDAEVDNPTRSASLDCNRKVFEAAKFDAGVWKDGWAFDTRKRKFYSTKLRLKGGNLHVRAYVGSEINGETEVFSRVAEVPTGCQDLKPESMSITGVKR